MAYRHTGCLVRRLITNAVLAFVAALFVTTVVWPASPITYAASATGRTPALGLADQYSVVPSVVGQSVAGAMAAPKTANLEPLVHASSMTGRVYRQAPVAGLRVLRGAVVSIWAQRPARA
jgi:hypothetical protein